MEAIEDEVVWRVDPIVHPRVAAEQIQDVPIAARIEHQARAPPPHLRVLPAGCRVRVSEGSLQLQAESVAEKEPDPAAAAALVGALESLVVPGVGAEPTQLQLMCVLAAQGGCCAYQQHPYRSDCPHGTTPPRRDFPPLTGAGGPQNRRFGRNARYSFGLTAY